MTQSSKALIAELEALRLPELQTRFQKVLGEETRCPNRTYLIRKIFEHLTSGAPAEKAATTQQATEEPVTLADEDVTELDEATEAPEPAPSAPVDSPTPDSSSSRSKPRDRKPRPPRGRFASMTIEELQAMYLDTVGRPTSSHHPGYLAWKIREAERGRVPVGPRKSRVGTGEPLDMRVLPLRLETAAVEALDAVWRDRGMKTRMEFLRRTLGHYLEHLGAEEAAARFGEG